MVYFTEKELATIALEALVVHGKSAADIFPKMCSALTSKGTTVVKGVKNRNPSLVEEIAAAANEAQGRMI